jgi:hypothetical protein
MTFIDFWSHFEFSSSTCRKGFRCTIDKRSAAVSARRISDADSTRPARPNRPRRHGPCLVDTFKFRGEVKTVSRASDSLRAGSRRLEYISLADRVSPREDLSARGSRCHKGNDGERTGAVYGLRSRYPHRPRADSRTPLTRTIGRIPIRSITRLEGFRSINTLM